jgi:hypothetical protein
MGPEREKEPRETPTWVTSPNDASSASAVAWETFSTCGGVWGSGEFRGCIRHKKDTQYTTPIPRAPTHSAPHARTNLRRFPRGVDGDEAVLVQALRLPLRRRGHGPQGAEDVDVVCGRVGGHGDGGDEDLGGVVMVMGDFVGGM